MPKSQFIDPAEVRKPDKISFRDIPVNAYQKTVKDELKSFSKDELVRVYRDMAYLREFETMVNMVKTQGNYNGVEHTYPGPAHLSQGQEAAAVGQAFYLGRDDFTFGSHRSHGEILAKALSCIEKLPDSELMKIMEEFLGGKTLKAVESKKKSGSVKELAVDFIIYGTIAEIFARETGFHLGLGGSMHAFFLPFGIYPNNAIVGGSAPTALGAALFKRCNGKKGIVVANAGDGSLGCGPVWESLNFAAMDQIRLLWDEAHNGGLPILFNFNNNGYGMGGQTRGETMAYDLLARIGAGITPSQMHAERIDGYNPLAVIDAYKRKKTLLENGEGPVLLDVLTYRYSGHSTSDASAYREKEELDAWMAVDPLITYRKQLIEAGAANDEGIEKILEDVRETVTRVTALAADEEASPYISLQKSPQLIEDMMFSNEKVSSFGDAEPEVLAAKEDCSRVKQIAGKERFGFKGGKAVSKIKAFNYRDALFEPIIDKYYEDSTLISYGEDVREWGGAFAVYRGLNEVIPYHRLFNSPISESAIVGSAVGYGMAGGRVIVELMYADFMGRAGDEIFNQLAKWQAMSAGILKMPVVLRVSVGSKYGAQHSQDWVALPAHIPGLKVCFPATPYEAKGLMTAALNGTDPVVFFESQRLYDMAEEFHEGGVPVEPYELEFGDVTVIREGGDLTLLTVGATLYKAVNAAKTLSEKYGIEAEIINLHSLVPLRYNRILESVRKTGRVVLTSDACTRGSFLSDVARNITELAFDDLDAPPVVVGAQNWITPPFEFDADFFPQESWILDAIHEKILPLKGHQPTVSSFTAVEQVRRAGAGV
ncbi:MAG: thiamine pyrophosphate-dependent enzyme [Oscillospiraceae bacterium]|nr:thiamine pyrophosphate-dependent enzyme [Oscillospiraceae bacterium]